MSPAFLLRLRISLRTPLLGVLLVLTAASGAVAASRLDPRFRFHTLTTAHFLIYFHYGEERLAARLGQIAEEVWPQVAGALGGSAPGRTHVILADQSELANGWATPFPYNTIFVTAAAPAGSEFIGRTDDWLRLVFTHEFTHVVQLDRSEAWARLLRGLFGRTPVAFPNVFLPGWAVEGMATWQESAASGEGRRYAGDFRAIERTAGHTGRVEPLDRINGALVDWPGGQAQYAYGVGFHEYLAERYGEAQFARLYAATAGRIPFLGTGAFERVYGRSLGALYDDYRRTLINRERPAAADAERPERLTRHGFTVLGPRFAPAACADCPSEIWYSVRNPHGLPALRAVSADGGNDRHIVTRYLGATQAATSKLIVFDEQELRRNAGVYSDLRLLDRRSGSVRQLTREQRLKDPDLSPDGRTIVAVREARGQRDLVLLPFDGSGVGDVATLIAEPETRFDAPRWSPDGLSIAVARQTIGHLSEIVVVDVSNGAVRVIASAPSTRFVTPAWRSDGAAIVAAADFASGPFDLYEFSVDATLPARRLTTTAGAIWPDVSADGRTLVFAGYTGEGFDVFTVPYRTGVAMSEPRPPISHAVMVTERSPQPDADAVSPYRPAVTLLPTSWNPIVETDEGTRVGVNLIGSDVLGRHAYSATATWLVSPPRRVSAKSELEPDWQFSYVYDRWRPVLFASASRSSAFFNRNLQAGSPPSSITLKQTEIEAGVLFPVRHVRTSHRLLSSVVTTLDRYSAPIAGARTTRTALRLGAATSTARFYGYSVSAEHGLSAAATSELVRRGFGSDVNATVTTADLRAYLPGFARHHVAALRLAGGNITQPAASRMAFAVGGTSAGPDVLDFGRDQLAPLRGFPSDTPGDTRVIALNADYRFPIARPQRGHGTWPVFLQNIHGAAFADAAAAGRDRITWRDAPFSIGGELSWDLVLGYSYPLTATAGASWGHDRINPRNRAAAFVRVGRAF